MLDLPQSRGLVCDKRGTPIAADKPHNDFSAIDRDRLIQAFWDSKNSMWWRGISGP